MSDALQIAHGEFGRVALLDMDRGLVRHAHPHCHVLLKVEGDDTQFLVGDARVALTNAQAVLVNAWEMHAYLHDPDRLPATILALYIEPAWLATFRPNWGASGGPDFFDRPVGQITPAIRALAHDLAAEMVHAPGSSRIADELLSRLMIALIERFAAWRTIGATLRLAAARTVDWRVRRTVERLRADPDGRLGADRLARDAGLSRAHFFRLFERATGASPHIFLNAIRVERAVAAIVADDEPLAALSGRLGFASPSHFSRFFRDHVSVAPRTFRARVQSSAAPEIR